MSSLKAHEIPKSRRSTRAPGRGVDSPCCLCRLSRGDGTASGASYDVVLARDDAHFVVPTKGSLVPGWVMVVPHRHVLSMAALPDPDRRRLLSYATSVRHRVERLFGPAAIFEHGPVRPGGATGCGVDHVHLHVVPLAFSLQREASGFFAPGLRWRSAADLFALPVDRDYLFVDSAGRAVVGSLAPPVSQALRRVIASCTGQPRRWDYREHPLAHVAEQTVTAWTGEA